MVDIEVLMHQKGPGRRLVFVTAIVLFAYLDHSLAWWIAHLWQQFTGVAISETVAA